MRKGYYILFALVIIVAFYVIYSQVDQRTKVNSVSSHVFSKGQELLIHTDANIQFKDQESKSYEFGVKDIRSSYALDSSLLTIVERILPNGDQFVFLKWFDDEVANRRLEDRAIQYSNKIDFTLLVDHANKHSIQSFAAKDLDRPHDNTVGIDELTYPNGLFRFTNFDSHQADIVLGKNYLSKKLVKIYEDESESFIRQLMEERSSYGLGQEENQARLHFDMVFEEGFISEQWLVFSEELLFESEEELLDFILFSNENYRSVNTWYTAEGVFSKLPWSVEPFAEEGYGRNLNYYREDTVLKRYRDLLPERYYYNVLVNSMVYFESHEKDENKLLETHYTSTWLKQDYQTTAPYIDSRHNELGAIYQRAITQELDLPYSEDPRLPYANFMLEQEALNNVIHVSDDAYLIADYYDPSPDALMTHVSLNHVLGIMNFLLAVYLDTNNEAYLEVATKIHLALMETKEEWIREDHDLWYQVNKDFEYDGRDYPIVTLRDLIDAEILWQEIRGDQDQVYSELIESKIKYLLWQKIDLAIEVMEHLEEANYSLEKLQIR